MLAVIEGMPGSLYCEWAPRHVWSFKFECSGPQTPYHPAHAHHWAQHVSIRTVECVEDSLCSMISMVSLSAANRITILDAGGAIQQAGTHLLPENWLSLATESGLLTVISPLPCMACLLSTQLEQMRAVAVGRA